MALVFIKISEKTPTIYGRDESVASAQMLSNLRLQRVLYSIPKYDGLCSNRDNNLWKPPVRLFETLTRQLDEEDSSVKVKSLK